MPERRLTEPPGLPNVPEDIEMFDSCICVDPDEVCELLSRERRKARTQHKCGECGHTIQPGQIYEVDATVFEGVFVAYKTCIPCVCVRTSLFSCGFFYGRLWADVHEAICCNGELSECVCPGREGTPQ